MSSEPSQKNESLMLKNLKLIFFASVRVKIELGTIFKHEILVQRVDIIPKYVFDPNIAQVFAFCWLKS